MNNGMGYHAERGIVGSDLSGPATTRISNEYGQTVSDEMPVLTDIQ